MCAAGQRLCGCEKVDSEGGASVQALGGYRWVGERVRPFPSSSNQEIEKMSGGQGAGLPQGEAVCRGVAGQGLREGEGEQRAEARIVWVCGAAGLGEEGPA